MEDRAGLAVMLILMLVSLPAGHSAGGCLGRDRVFLYLPSLVFDGDLDFLNQYQYFCNRNADCVSPTFHKTFIEAENGDGAANQFWTDWDGGVVAAVLSYRPPACTRFTEPDSRICGEWGFSALYLRGLSRLGGLWVERDLFIGTGLRGIISPKG